MTDKTENPNHPVITGVETIKEIMSSEHDPNELKRAVKKLEKDVSTQGLLEQAEEGNVLLARETISMLIKQPGILKRAKSYSAMKRIHKTLSNPKQTEEEAMDEVGEEFFDIPLLVSIFLHKNIDEINKIGMEQADNAKFHINSLDELRPLLRNVITQKLGDEEGMPKILDNYDELSKWLAKHGVNPVELVAEIEIALHEHTTEHGQPVEEAQIIETKPDTTRKSPPPPPPGAIEESIQPKKKKKKKTKRTRGSLAEQLAETKEKLGQLPEQATEPKQPETAQPAEAGESTEPTTEAPSPQPPPPPADAFEDAVTEPNTTAEEVDISDLVEEADRTEEQDLEKNVRLFEEQFRKHPEANILLEVLKGDIEALKRRGYNVKPSQISQIARKGIEPNFRQVVANNKEAVRFLTDRPSPYVPSEIDPNSKWFESLMKTLEPYKEDATKDISTGKRPDTTDEKLAAADRAIEALDKEADEISDSQPTKPKTEEEWKTEAEKTPEGKRAYEFMKRLSLLTKTKTSKEFSRVLKEKGFGFRGDTEAKRKYNGDVAFKRLKNSSSAISKAFGTVATIDQVIKSATTVKDVLHTNKLDHLVRFAEDRRGAPVKLAEAIEGQKKEMKKVAEIAPEQFKELSRLLGALRHYDVDMNSHLQLNGQETLDVLGVNASTDINQLKAALEEAGFSELLTSKSPQQAIGKLFKDVQYEETDLPRKLQEKIDEIKKVIEEKKTKFKPHLPVSQIIDKREKVVEIDQTSEQFKEMGRLMGALRNYDPDLNSHYRLNGQETLDVLGVNASTDINQLKAALEEAGFGDIFTAKNPQQVIRKLLTGVEHDESDLPNKLQEKIDEIKNVIEERKTKFKPHLPAFQPAIEYPETIRSLLKNGVKEYVKGKPEQELFEKAWEIMESDTKTDLQKELKQIFETIVNSQQHKPIPEWIIKTFVDEGLKPKAEAILKVKASEGTESEAKTEDPDKEFFTTFALGKMKEKFEKIYQILEINPEDIEDLGKRSHLIEIQQDLLIEIKEIKQIFPLEKLKELRLKGKRKAAQEILEKMSDIDEFIDIFNTELIMELPEAVVAGLRPAAPATPTAKPAEAGKGVEVSDGEVKSEASLEGVQMDISDTGAKSMRERESEVPRLDIAFLERAMERTPTQTDSAEAADSDIEIGPRGKRLFDAVLSRKELIRNDDPVCLAIDQLIRTENINVTELISYLQNPDLLNKNINKEWIQEEREKKGNPTLQELLQKLDFEMNENLSLLQESKSLRPTTEETKERTKARTRVTEIRELKRQIEIMMQMENRTLTYNSPRHILALANLFLQKDASQPNQEQITGDIESQIRKQKDRLRSGFSLNKAAFFLRPTLGSTLKALAKDKEFKKMGDDPEAKMAELAKWGWNNPMKVKQWVENLPGGYEAHINSTIPRLIAYLEMAIRDGKVNHILNTKRAEDLISHLKQLRKEQIMAEVDAIFQQNPKMTNQAKMLLYLQKMNESTRHTDDISKDILKWHSVKSKAIKVGAFGGVAALGTIAPLALVAAGLPAIGSIGAYITSFTKKVPDEKMKKAVRSGAIRTFMANGLAIGGFMAGGLVLGLPMAAAGMFAPELGKKAWKHKKEIGIGAAKFTGKAAVGFLKYTVGLPYYGFIKPTKKIAEKLM